MNVGRIYVHANTRRNCPARLGRSAQKRGHARENRLGSIHIRPVELAHTHVSSAVICSN